MESQPQLFKCGICHKPFDLAKSLSKHVELIHSQKKLQKEVTIDLSTSKNSSKAMHEKTLTKVQMNDKVFICKYCNRIFKQKDKVKIHERIHTGEKPYSCSVCDKKFSSKTSMKTHEFRLHELIHSKEKPNIENSQKRFQNKVSIDTISHTIDKAEGKTEKNIKQVSDDFEMSTIPSKKKGAKKMCTICNKHFRDNYALKKHEKVHIKAGEMSKPELVAKPEPEAESVPEPVPEMVYEPVTEAVPEPEAVSEPEAEPVLAKPDLSELDYDETDVKTENYKDKILQPNEKNTVFQSEIPAFEIKNQKEKHFSCNVCAEKFSWHTAMINHRLIHSIKVGIKNEQDFSLELSLTEPKIKPEIDISVAEIQNETSENHYETSFEEQNEVSDDPVKREEEEKTPKCQICNVYTMCNMYKYQFIHTYIGKAAS